MAETREAQTIIAAEEPSAEFRSMWTDLRGVSFEQGFLDVKGTSIRYLRSGAADGPKLIMLPGTGGHAETFAPNIGPLGKHFDCWAIDIPGSGYSDKSGSNFDAIHTARFIKDWAEVVGAAQIDIVGCSLGSWNAIQTAHLYPALVRHMVLVSPAGAPMPEPGDATYEFWMNRDIGGAVGIERRKMVEEPTWEKAERVLKQLIPDARRLPDDMIAARLDVSRQPGAASENGLWYLDFDARMANTLTKEQVRELKTPTLLVVEREDQNRAMVDALFAALPNGRLVVIDGVGHWAHYEAPNQFNELALEFLRDDAL